MSEQNSEVKAEEVKTEEVKTEEVKTEEARTEETKTEETKTEQAAPKTEASPISAMMKDAGILFAITLISGLVLGGVNMITSQAIEAQELAAKQEAYKEVFTTAASFEPVDTTGATDVIIAEFPMQQIDEAVKALDASGNVQGYVVTVTTKEGYGGNIQFSLGIQNDGTLNGMSILSIAETAGLGMRAEEVLKPQFANRNVEKFTYVKGGAAAADDEINAISGATVTSNAVTNGVNAGLLYFRQALKGGA